jgi:hypothetical protein
MFENSLQYIHTKLNQSKIRNENFYNDFTIHAFSLNYNWSNFWNFRKPIQSYEYLVSDWPVFFLDRLLIGRFQWKTKRIEFHHLLTKISETNSVLFFKEREGWEIFFLFKLACQRGHENLHFLQDGSTKLMIFWSARNTLTWFQFEVTYWEKFVFKGLLS